MSNLVFDSRYSDFFSRAYRSPWIVQQYCDTEDCCNTDYPRVHTSEHEYAFEVDVPGIEKDDLIMELDKNILNIYTKSDNAEKDAQKDETVQERKRTYRFQYKVPDDIDATQLKATLKNGVLAVTLPKSEEKKPIKVPVMIE